MSGTIATWPYLAYEVAFNALPNQNTIPAWWSSVSARTTYPWSTTHGRQYELDTNESGQWTASLDNRDGALDPANPASPYAPGVVPYRGARIRAQPGPNLLTPDQATAGEGSGFAPGPLPAQLNISNDIEYALVLAASLTAYQGSQVYQTTVPASAGAGSTVLLVTAVPVTAATAYSFSAQVRINTSGQNIATCAAVQWYNSSAALISTTTGSATTITGGSATWTALSASGTAPAGAVIAILKVEVASGSTTATTTYQSDGMQFEASAFPTSFVVPGTASVNFLPRVIATGSTALAVTDTVANWWYTSGATSTLAQAANLAAAPTGHTTALGWHAPAGTTASSTALYLGNYLGLGGTGPQGDNIQVTAGTAYTYSYYTMRASSADATVNVTPAIRWYDANANLLSTTTGGAVTVPVSPTWSARVTVSGTAPAGAMWARLAETITTPASTTAANTIYHTAYQAEASNTASTWADPGAMWLIYDGFAERYPQSWTMNGTYGTADIIAVDGLAALAQYTLAAPFINEVLALGPNFIYELGDPAGSMSCADTSGKRVAAPVEAGPAGAGSVTFGSAASSVSPAGGIEGTPATVADFANNPAGSGSPVQENETFVSLHKTTIAPGPPPNGNWTRLIAFNAPATPAATTGYTIWSALPPSVLATITGVFQISLLPTTGTLNIDVFASSGTGQTYNAGPNMCDGNWHQVAVTCDGSGNVAMYVDGASVLTGALTLPISQISCDVLGASVQLGANYYRAGMVGSIATAIEIPSALSAAQITNLYNSWRLASSGESTGARVSRVLTWIGYKGPTAIDAGVTAHMGPATDLTGATALDALNAIALTENGNAYISNFGVMTFKSRGSRYGSAAPTFTFGEYQSAGEWPYDQITPSFDSQHLFNLVQVTQYSTSQVATAVNLPSQAANFPRLLQRTINVANYSEAADAASYLVQQYKSARSRLADLTLHPSGIPGLFNVCLQLEIGTRIRVMRRTPSAPAQQYDLFIESVAWEVNPEAGDAVVHLQCSPADLASYWVLASMHTTLHAQANSGASSISINALPDAAVNKLISSMPQTQQLTLEPGTVRAETVTVVPPLPTTSVGYASATLNVTPNLAFTHAIGTVVCEPLPAGVTDPTTYDTQSVLGAASTTFAVAATSGTNTITIAALSDGTANALASDLPQGQVLWLSPGTTNFETATVSPAGIAATYPGYQNAVLTLTANLAHNHAIGDIVCEPLPAGDTSPSQIPATTRIAY